MSNSVLAPIMHTLQESLRSTDVRSWLSGLDFKTGGLLVIVVVVVFLLLDLFTKSYAPYGRSLVASAAQTWLERDPLVPVDSVRGRFVKLIASLMAVKTIRLHCEKSTSDQKIPTVL